MFASTRTASHPRTHVVLIPGFVGFDALGQLPYYAGISAVFQEWAQERGARDVAIHYFDNFPTASVSLRAERLLHFLAKKVLRGEFAEGDRVVLVGHSTGALDMRRLLYRLTTEDPSGFVTLDGACKMAHADILRFIQRLCFLSAPHFGTNIADFAVRLRETAQSSLRGAALGVQLNRDPVASTRRALTKHLPEPRSSLVLAIADALNESDEFLGKPDKSDEGKPPKSGADEREARAQLALWLEHMSKEFGILEDLRGDPTLRAKPAAHGVPKSPAHFGEAERQRELASWSARGITTRSYCTRVSDSPQRKNPLLAPLIAAVRAGAPLLNVLSDALTKGSKFYVAPLVAGIAYLAQTSLPAAPALGALTVLNAHPELLFELFCMLCAEGPFERPASICGELTDFASGNRVSSEKFEVSQSDGVVNTLSMLWPPPDPEKPEAHTHFLVEGDHGEIIGHCANKLINPDAPHATAVNIGRKYYAYDFFQSKSTFAGPDFTKVWRHLFDFCIA
ncbi:MAG: hypothetical protein QM778_34755 [Myxococcales bacterium]